MSDARLLTALVASTSRASASPRNEQAWIKQRLDALVAPDNVTTTICWPIRSQSPRRICSAPRSPSRIYRARRGGAPVAAVIRPIAPDGYRGPIELLVAIGHDGRLIGVQVIRHDETPGLGDAFESRDAHWLDAFAVAR